MAATCAGNVNRRNVGTRWRLRSLVVPPEQLCANFWFVPNQGLLGTVAATESSAKRKI